MWYVVHAVDAGFVDLTVKIPGLTGCAYYAGIAGRSTELAGMACIGPIGSKHVGVLRRTSITCTIGVEAIWVSMNIAC